MKELLRSREALAQILADHTGHSIEQVMEETQRDYWMTAKEAQEYHIVDQVMDPRGKSAATAGQ